MAFRKAAAVILPALILTAGGCDFFKSSGPEGGVSPFVSDLRISHSAVACGRDFTVSFRYQDPQDDIEFMRVTFQHEGGFLFEVEMLWQTGGDIFVDGEDLFGGSLDLSVPGRAIYTYQFECDTDKPTGSYLVTIILVDDNEHESSPRSDSISLISS